MTSARETAPALASPTLAALRSNVASLPPACFAMVMATGIISIGAYQLGLIVASRAVMGVAMVAYVLLVLLSIWRGLAYPRRVADDLHDPRRAFGFFTIVAGTNVVGICLKAVDLPGGTLVLLVISAVGWLVLGYLVPWFAVLGRAERPVLALANGSWFIWVVAVQSVAVVSATLEPLYANGRHALSVIAVMCWSIGLILYCACAVFLALRLLVYPLAPSTTVPAGVRSQAVRPEDTTLTSDETTHRATPPSSTRRPKPKNGSELLTRWSHPACSSGAVKISGSPSTSRAWMP